VFAAYFVSLFATFGYIQCFVAKCYIVAVCLCLPLFDEHARYALYIYVMIEPLTYTTDHAGTRTKWRDSIPQLYTDLRTQGYTHADIITGWGISDNTLAIWTARSPALAHAIDNAPSTPATHNPKPEPCSQESLAHDIDLAYSALRKALRKVEQNPESARISEIVALANAILDRRIGKPIQSSIVTGNTAIHIIGHVMPPASQLKVIDNVIEGG